MIVLILLAFVGMLTGIFLILGMTPFTFAEELTKPLSGRRQPISKRIQQVNHPKEPKGIRKTVLEAREMLILTGKGWEVCRHLCFLSVPGGNGRCDLYCDSELLYAAGFGGRDGLASVLVCPVHLSQL